MPTYPNGAIPAAALTTVQGGMQLRTGTARAWKRLAAAAKKKLGRTIAIAGPAGAYRSLATQKAMRAAFYGTAADKHRWNLNPASTVPPSPPGGSRHGDALAVDVIGTPMDNRFLVLAAQHGFKRPWPEQDPNHLLHDGKTATAPTSPAAVTPAKKQVQYVVRDGDTLGKIAARYSDPRDKKADLTVDDLLALNPSIEDADHIHVGQKIRVA